jgi:hypothetical protein
MANEAILRDTNVKTSRRFTIASSADVKKGTFLKLSGDQTAAASTGSGDLFIGFAHASKDPTDYATSITADKGGIYELIASGAIALGAKVSTAAPGNMVKAATAAEIASTAAVIVGVAQEAASDAEKINVEVYA